MRVLSSTIGSRGDVQPLVALGLQLRVLDQEVHFCVPPDFRDWIEGFGMPITTIGPELRSIGKANPSAAPLTQERRRQMAETSVAGQFEKITLAAQGADFIVGATALQIAAPSVAESMGIPYAFAAYCPSVLPSSHHAPPVLGLLGDTPAPTPADYARLWAQDAERFNLFNAALNTHRASLGLSPVSDVRSHIFTNQPWLAADPILAPWPEPADEAVFQTGAWILPDERPLSPDLETFLDAGEPPVYFGLGSMGRPQDLSHVMVQTARAIGHRAILSRGDLGRPALDDLSLVYDEPDCLTIGEANLQALFKRVAAVVHHGGAGTTTLAALAGAPQVVIPQRYDQHYWAGRIHYLGIGNAHAPGTPTTNSLTSALEHTLQPNVAARAQSIATTVRRDGALTAARHLIISA